MSRAISNLTLSPKGRVAVRSKRAAARKAVAVSAARETRASTLMRAKPRFPEGRVEQEDRKEVFNG
ncbi:MAG: hypothetical protein EBZ78_09545 [Verrucomicrobia bacterium]|nr:hypothetical protein [Verrucomicrobiota bacterium]